MKELALEDLVEAQGLSGAGRNLGCGASSIQKALATRRDIRVTRHKDGTYSAIEIKPFPSTRPAAESNHGL